VTNVRSLASSRPSGYRTVAEGGLDSKDHPGIPAELLAPGAMVFTPPDGLLDLSTVRSGGARCRALTGVIHPAPAAGSKTGPNHPAADIAYEDAQVYARWLGGELPTEAQWEFAEVLLATTS
jgi:formylglycine-generating enzyme